jgi:hypothetical protein
MNVLRVAWLVVVEVLAVVGIGAALVLSPAALVLLVGVAVIGTVLMLLAVSEDEGRPHGGRTSQLLTSGLAVGTVAGALVGFASLLGAGVFPLALSVIVTSPYAWKASSRWRRSRLTSSPASLDATDDAVAHTRPGLGPAPAPMEPTQLTDEELCLAWRASYWALRDGSSGTEVMDAVTVRQCILDEFERRNSTGLSAWLASGARAAGNPLPFLAESRVDSPAIDWDEFTRGQGF